MLNVILTNLASDAATEEGGGIFSSLGIDLQMLLFQLAGFVLVVWLMAKYVYPVLLRVIDEREAKIEEGLSAAREAEDSASKAQESVDKQLAKARKEAREIVNTAKDEASDMLTRADEKAKMNSERVIEQAREEIQKETLAAKKALHNETIELVALATEKVTGNKVDAKSDAELISKALKEADS